MREVLGADLIFAHEAASAATPAWLTNEWSVLQGEHGRFRKDWNWGSVIASKPRLQLQAHQDALQDPWLAQLYDLVLIGELELPVIGKMLIASVHTAASSVRDWVRDFATSLTLSSDEVASLQRPGCRELPYINDFAFTALARTVRDQRFFISGDWNTCRRYPGGPQFFERARLAGWVECHKNPEQQSYFGKGQGAYQLDHAFCDVTTASSVASCTIVVDSTVRSLSDHAPLVIDLELNSN